MRLTRSLMGMPIVIEAVDGVTEAGIEAAFAKLEHIDAVFSTYKPDSVVSRLNRDELARSNTPAEVQEVLAACDELRAETNGYFAYKFSGLLDPSGYVKGWAINEACQVLRSRGCRNYYVAAGGDVQAAGHNTAGKPWTAGIRHPSEPNKFAKTLQLRNAALATSGTYERGLHIINPHTGKPTTDLLSLSIVGPQITRVDALATAAFAMGTAGLAFIAAQPNLEGYMITVDHQAFATPGFARYVLRAS